MFAINLITFMVADLVVASLERVTPPLHCGRRKPRSSYAGNTAVDGRRRELPTSHTTGDTPGRQCFVRRWWQDHLLQLHLTMFGIVCWVCFMDAVRNIAGKKKKQTWFLGRTRMETLWEKSFIKRNHLSEVFSMQHILVRFKKNTTEFKFIFLGEIQAVNHPVLNWCDLTLDCWLHCKFSLTQQHRTRCRPSLIFMAIHEWCSHHRSCQDQKRR